MGPLRLQVLYTMDDYREANRAFRKRQRGQSFRNLDSWLVVAISAAFGLFMVGRPQPASTPAAVQAAAQPTNPLPSIISAILPWLALYAVLFCWLYWRIRRRVSKAWRGQPKMQLAQDILIFEAGVLVNDPVSRAEYKWTAFVRYIETPNLFLLFLSELTFVMIPKRGFGSVEEVNQCRGFFEAYISQRPPSAFPVILPPNPVIMPPPPLTPPTAAPSGPASPASGPACRSE